MSNIPNTADNTVPLAYDLRQGYAKIVSMHLDYISEARIAQDYYLWFKGLVNLYTVTSFKYKKRVEYKNIFNRYKKRIVNLSNQYPMVWAGKSNNPNHCALIDQALRDLEESLYNKISQAKIFGDTSFNAEL